MEIQNESGNEEEMEESGENTTGQDSNANSKVYLPGKPLEEGEELVCDQTAYIMYHQAQTSAPCLSFDIIRDNLGDDRETFPMTAYIASGTQASKSHTNSVIVMKLSNLHRTAKEDEDDESDDDDDIDDEKAPKMSGAVMKHLGGVNRIRVSCKVNFGKS